MFTINASIVCRNVWHRYSSGTLALKGLSFEAFPGECLGLLGPNGAGKSTALNIISTALKQTDGEVIVLGHKYPRETAAIRGLIGYCPQGYALDPLLSVYDNLKIAGLAKGLRGQLLESKIQELLQSFGIGHVKEKIVAHISGGQARRLQLLRSIIAEPQILILDEPTLGIDPEGLKTLSGFVRGLTEAGHTVILATNDMEQGEQLCDRVVFIANGKAFAAGPTEWFIKQYGGKEMVTIAFANTVGEVERNALEQMLGASIQHSEGGSISILCGNASETLAQLIDCDAVKKLGLKKVDIRKPNLKDAFLQLKQQAEEVDDESSTVSGVA